MAFWIASSPHNHNQTETSALMRLVIYALIPGVIAQWYFFGWGNLIHIAIAVVTALLAEFIVLSLRSKHKDQSSKQLLSKQVFDGSAILTAALIGLSLPALAPWWITVVGSIFAIVIVKQLYGGLGQNPFNPAMAAYVMLLISFPVQMTSWQPPLSLMSIELNISNTISTIFTGFTNEGYSVEQLRANVDGFTMATPLDTLKTDASLGYTVYESMEKQVFGDNFSLGWEWVNGAFLLGGIFLIFRKAIAWQTPVSFLLSLFVCTFIAYSISPDQSASTMFHWLSGGCMLGAFFILTDPVSGATSVKGRLFIGALAGLLVYVIRDFGGYPDGVAFAVLLCNMAAPLVDQYTRPRTYGHQVNTTNKEEGQ